MTELPPNLMQLQKYAKEMEGQGVELSGYMEIAMLLADLLERVRALESRVPDA